MTLLITGSTTAYSENWDRIFSKKKAGGKKKAAKGAKQPARKKRSRKA